MKKQLSGMFAVIGAVMVALWIQIALMGAVDTTGKFSTRTAVKTEDLWVTDDALVAGDLDLTGAVTISAAGSMTNSGATILPSVTTWTALSLTSPAVTCSLANVKTYATLVSDANLTGIYFTGGTKDHVYVIKSGAGSNTMRLDDGTSMTLGGNITLTEGQEDLIALWCTTTEGDEFVRLWSADN